MLVVAILVSSVFVKKKKYEGRSCPIVADVFPKQFSHFQHYFLVNLQKPERSAGSFSSSAVLRETSSLHRFNVTKATTIQHHRPWMMKQPLISIVTMFFSKVNDFFVFKFDLFEFF